MKTINPIDFRHKSLYELYGLYRTISAQARTFPVGSDDHRQALAALHLINQAINTARFQRGGPVV